MTLWKLRAYVERLLDESRLAPGLAAVARAVRRSFAEASEASDSAGPALPASDYAGIYEIRFEWGFQEAISCLKSGACLTWSIAPADPLH